MLLVVGYVPRTCKHASGQVGLLSRVVIVVVVMSYDPRTCKHVSGQVGKLGCVVFG